MTSILPILDQKNLVEKHIKGHYFWTKYFILKKKTAELSIINGHNLTIHGGRPL